MNNYLDEVARLEQTSLKIFVGDIPVYILDMKYHLDGKLDLEYICFHKDSESPEFYKNLQDKVKSFLSEEIRKEKDNKWYKILFSKACVIIKNIRKKFGLS